MFRIQFGAVLCALVLVCSPGTSQPSGPAEAHVVKDGIAQGVRVYGDDWTHADGYLEGTGQWNFLHADRGIGAGDFQVRVRMSIQNVRNSAASFVFQGNNHFGFEDADGNMFVEGPCITGDAIAMGRSLAWEGHTFLFEVVREGDLVQFSIDGRMVFQMRYDSPEFGTVGVRPWRGTMRIHDFTIVGETYPLAPEPEQVDVFVSSTEGYHTFRIPAVVRTQAGTILAFCEGRKSSGGDSGNIDLVLKRSFDGGETWGPMQIIVNDVDNTCGNPAPVVDRDTGIIWMPITKNPGNIHEGQINEGKGIREVWLTKSEDDGASWSEAINISATTRYADWRWYATGPCHGIQLESGRLVIPCDHSHGPDFETWHSHVIYSDDHGASWQMGGTVGSGKMNESTVLEREDGSLLLNMRSYRGIHRRAVATSQDGGITWSEAKDEDVLIEPRCQATILRLTSSTDMRRGRILFSNPASTRREVMAVRMSYDDGETWPAYKWLHLGPAAYSDLVALDGGAFGCLYERGKQSAYEKVTFARLGLNWLTDGRDRFESGN